MKQTDPVSSARRSFAFSRRVAEKNLARLREEARLLRDFRHRRGTFAWAWYLRWILMLAWPLYLWQMRKNVALLQETRWRIRFYRQVEADLERGDLGSAIEALARFIPREETTAETIRRVRRSPVSVRAILRSPNVVRQNMLQLRNDLVEIQRAKAC